MKKYLITAAVCWALAGCGGEQTAETDIPEPDSSSVTESELIGARIDAASEKLIASFASSVLSELTLAFQEDRITDALRVCGEAAPMVPDSIPAEGWALRRVTENYRNPDNRATLDELEIIAQFADVLDAPDYIGCWEESDSLMVYRYYQPIRVLPVCLKCHGNFQTLQPGILTRIKKAYPTDRATGYSSGDLRGMYIVEVSWPEGEYLAAWLLGDSLPERPVSEDSVLGDSVPEDSVPLGDSDSL